MYRWLYQTNDQQTAYKYNNNWEIKVNVDCELPKALERNRLDPSAWIVYRYLLTRNCSKKICIRRFFQKSHALLDILSIHLLGSVGIKWFHAQGDTFIRFLLTNPPGIHLFTIKQNWTTYLLITVTCDRFCIEIIEIV